MAIHIIIDGYNLIRQSDTLSSLDHRSLQLGREKLIEWLAAYKREKKHPITVVFDGANAPPFAPHKGHCNGVHIIFSRNGELADAVIKHIVSREKERALVVTSDLEISSYALAKGAGVISSPEFENRLALSAEGDPAPSEGEKDNAWKPSTRKKGPRKRLSRRRRRSIMKIRKL